MGLIIRGECQNCSFKTADHVNGYIAVLMDTTIQAELSGLTVSPDEDDPRFLILRHPCESHDLAKASLTWNDLFWQGRQISCEMVICPCGWVFSRRNLSSSSIFGCSGSFFASIFISISVGIWKSSWGYGGATFLIFLVLTTMFLESFSKIYTSIKFSGRAKALSQARLCPKCFKDEAQSMRSNQVTVCPECKCKTLALKAVGIS